MKSRLFIIIASLALLMGITAAPVTASHPDGTTRHPNNYAGRPLSGDSYGADLTPIGNEIHCQVLAYGRVAGDPVAFIAKHCIDIHPLNDNIADHNGVSFGKTPASRSHCSSAYDLCFIWLYGTSKFPHNPHQVYGGRDGDRNALWATISTYQGSSQWNCASMPSRIGSGVHAYRQDTIASSTQPRSGSVIGYGSTSSNGPCDIITSHATTGGRWSGTPLMNCDLGTCSLIGVGRSKDSNGDLHFGNIREGIAHLNNIWANSGGAKFCTTANCAN